MQSQLINRERQIQDLQDQLSSREQLIRQYREQITLLENQTIYLQQEINRISNMTRIVQSEKYLLNITGVLRLRSSYSSFSDERESTYFTTLGKQIKVELKLRTEPPIKADISSQICVYYSFKGASVQVSCEYLDHKDWEFYVHPQTNFTFYLKLDKIPENYFGKVPLFIKFSIRIGYPSHNSYLFYELTAYDVYPP